MRGKSKELAIERKKEMESIAVVAYIELANGGCGMLKRRRRCASSFEGAELRRPDDGELRDLSG